MGLRLRQELLSNGACRPIHDAVLGFEPGASWTRCAVPRAGRRTKRLPKRFTERLRALEALRHPDGTPVYRVEETPNNGGGTGWTTPQATAWRATPCCRAERRTWDHCGKAARAGRGGAPGVQDALLRAEPCLAAQTADHWVRRRGQRAKAGLAGGGGDHAAGHGALGGPGLRGAERRREVPAAGRLPAVAGRAGLLGRAAHQRGWSTASSSATWPAGTGARRRTCAPQIFQKCFMVTLLN